MANHQNNLKQPTAQLSRHAHDITAGYTSSLAPGMIVPQYFHIMQPKDKIYFKSLSFARLQDVITAFLGQVDIHIDYFFVPLQMLYTPFGQIFAQTDDYLSSLYSEMSRKDTFPLLDVQSSQAGYNNEYFPDFSFECWGCSTSRLIDALNGNPLVSLSNYGGEHVVPEDAIAPEMCYHPKVSPWLFAAYQAIYQKYYRNDQLEKLRVSAYNFDAAYNQTSFSDGQYLTLRYHQRPNDYFTSVRPSPMYSAVNSLASQTADEVNGFGAPNELLNKVNNYLGGSALNFVQDYELSSFEDATFHSDMSTASSVYDNLESINNASRIRTLFAVDKFLRVYGRAGKTYDEQILAHFGYKIPHDVKHDLTKIKSYRFSLTTDPIYATSTTEDSNLGQVGGQASNSLNTDFESFEAPVHGVFMAVAYALTKPRYQGTFSKLHLLSERLKFPIPEFDKLGAQPLFAFESHPAYLSFEPDSEGHTYYRLGWQNRYSEFKQKYNRISLNYITEEFALQSRGVGANVFNPWVLSRFPFDAIANPTSIISKQCLDVGYFFETPKALNNVMVVGFDGGWSDTFYANPHLMFNRDPIIFEFQTTAKLVSWMSETGEPDI